jgi:hypothetical protein
LAISSLGIAVFLLIYYAAAGFFTIFYSTVFVHSNGLNFTVAEANRLNEWFWGADAVALIVVGLLSDLLKVRKPFMLVGAVGSIGFLIAFLMQTTHPHTGFYTLVLLEVGLATCLSLTYAPWMAGYTEMVEAKNPALVGTGLALWGWILRLVVGISFIFLPVVITSVNPVVNNLQYSQLPPNGTAPFNVQQFQLDNPAGVAFAQKNASWLKVLSEPQNLPIATAANKNPTAANLAAFQRAVGPVVFAKAVANLAGLNKYIVPHQAEYSYLSAHQAQLNDLVNGVSRSASQWKDWFWVCVGGMVLFIPTIWLNRSRWSPARARKDEAQHQADVVQELRELVGSPT